MTVAAADLRLGPWGFGGAGVGNLGTAIDDATAAAAIEEALAAGARYFDTAPHYGLGLSERRIGVALSGRPRDAFAVSTKVGRRLVPARGAVEAEEQDGEGFVVPARWRRVWDFTPGGLRRALEESLQRLRLTHVDIAFLHDPEEHDLALAMTQALPALRDLREEGMARAVGVGSKSVDALLATVRTGLVDTIMVAGRYTLLDRQAETELLPECAERTIPVIVASPFNSGALSRPVPNPALPYDYGRMPTHVFARVRAIADVCADFGVSLPAAALAFPRRHPAVMSVVIGAQTAEQVRENARRFAESVPDTLWDALESAGLL